LSREKIPLGKIFFGGFTENLFMKTEFWPNIEKLRIKANKERKAIISECGLTSNAFSRGLERKSDPGVSTAYRLAKSFKKTIEELLDGEAGAEYVRQLASKEGWGFTPPKRIADIVEGLSLLDDNELGMIRGAVMSAVDHKKGTGTDGLPG
jgi:transcriptional regulator with XRE-family HTH domain